MTGSLARIMVLTPVLLVLMAAAAYGGWYLAVRTLINNWVQEQSTDISGQVLVLDQLRSGHTDSAIEILESQMDADLIVLVPEDFELQAPVKTQTLLAIQAARQYRERNPRQSDNAGISSMVNQVLNPPSGD